MALGRLITWRAPASGSLYDQSPPHPPPLLFFFFFFFLRARGLVLEVGKGSELLQLHLQGYPLLQQVLATTTCNTLASG